MIKLILILLVPSFMIINGFIFLFEKDRPEGLVAKIYGLIIWIILPTIFIILILNKYL
jgi:hypothetical protein